MKTIFSLAIFFTIYAVHDVQAALLRGADPSVNGFDADDEGNENFLTDVVLPHGGRNLGWLDSSCTECETRSDCSSVFPKTFQCKYFPEAGKKYCLRRLLGETDIPNGCTCKDTANDECQSGRCEGICVDKLGSGETCNESVDCESGNCEPNFRRPSSCA